MKLIYESVRAALTFVLLSDIPRSLDAFLEHIERAHPKTRPKQIELFVRQLRRHPSPADAAIGTTPPDVSTSGSSAAPPQPPAGRSIAQRTVCEAWRAAKLVDAAFRAACVFIPLHEIPAKLSRFMEHVERSCMATRPKQIDLFQRELRPAAG